ncbi:MAG TPA: Fur family transcriptional regulator [Tetragenococcus sp.]|nr:Fur family transcriptional regulator [Tetragenococcus sp.]
MEGILLESYEEAIQQLKKENIRITPQRQAILEFLANTHQHPTAEDIYKAIEEKFPGMSVATVYNNLKLFVSIGFIKELSYGDASSRFDFHTDSHYHAICNRCGKITDFHYPGLEDVEMAAGKLTGYQVSSHRLEVYGLCPECREELNK